MYKNRIAKWGFDKKHKRHEVLVMIRKKAQRAAIGKGSTFHVRGESVDMIDVDRYLRRAGLSIQDAINLSAATPPTIRCSTPDSIIYSPNPPRQYEVCERILESVRNYISGSFDNGTWISISHEEFLQIPEGDYHMKKFFYTMNVAQGFLDWCQFGKAGIYLNSGFALIKSILIEQTADILINIFYFITKFQRQFPAIATAMITQFAGMSLIVLKGSHPLKQLFAELRSPDLTSVQQAVEMGASCIADIFELRLGWSLLIVT